MVYSAYKPIINGVLNNILTVARFVVDMVLFKLIRGEYETFEDIKNHWHLFVANRAYKKYLRNKSRQDV